MNTGHRAKKRFGQHFLTNPSIAAKIADAAALTPDDTVLEIGPGRGILTEQLLSRAGQVVAVEIDRTLIPLLTDSFGADNRFSLIEQDILTVDLPSLFAGVSGRIAVCANIPYNITAPIIELLTANHALIDRAVLMVQREVADRLLAPPGTKQYGLPTLNLSLAATVKKVMTVAPGSFTPPPEVTSAVVALTFSPELRYQLIDQRLFHQITGAVFRQRRKMIRNTLGQFCAQRGITPENMEEALGAAGIDPKTRPETVDTARFVILTNALAGFLPGTRGNGG